MEFLGEDNPQPKYSGVMWRAVWVLGGTLSGTIIEGWAKADKKYHVSYIYTININLTFLHGIGAGATTSVLESAFQAKLYDFSAEYGAVGHLQEVWGGDDVLALGLLIEYDNGVITQIMARNEFVQYDSVPLVPSSKKINNFVGEKIDELKQLAPFRGMTVEKTNKWVQINPQQNVSQRIPQIEDVSHTTPPQTKFTYNATSIVLLALVVGALLSALIVWLFKVLQFHYMMWKGYYVHPYTQTRQNLHTEAKRDDTAHSRKTLNDDFDYPY